MPAVHRASLNRGLHGDVEVGKGIALVSTPGHTDGNHSLCINTPEGVWVSSENGVAADSWHPHLSKIPGVRKYAEFWNREVVLNANTLEDSVDQYDSMLKEKAVADPNRRDPRWLNVFPSSEMTSWRRQWPVLPTFMYGGMNYGTIERPAIRLVSRQHRGRRILSMVQQGTAQGSGHVLRPRELESEPTASFRLDLAKHQPLAEDRARWLRAGSMAQPPIPLVMSRKDARIDPLVTLVRAV